MPPRTALSSPVAHLIQTDQYVCLSCTLKRSITSSPQRTSLRKATTTKRAEHRPRALLHPATRKEFIVNRSYATTSNGSLASSTAINAPKTVPHELRRLHQHLQSLREKASSYVDLSRLQLAIRSLESSDPVVRIAFLGLGVSGVQTARRLARVLLADALSDEEEWERELVDEVEGGDGRSVLIKYGEAVEDVGVRPASRPLVRELRVPSRLLRSSNVEILVTGLNASGLSANAEGADELEQSILVPPLTIPGAGRVGFVTYPVHQAVVVAEGVQGAVEFGRLPASLVDGRLVQAALSLPLRKDADTKTERDVREVDVGLAEHALGLFRTNKANGAIFSSEWQASRVGGIGTWMKESTASGTADTGLKPAVKELLSSLLSRATQSVSQTSSNAEASSTALTIPDTKRQALQNAIASWSEESHRDLQINLSTALSSPTWKRTTWWRLFYRIDEVSISASDILRRGWLVEAEQSLAFISGRILEAGLASEQQLKGGATAEQAKKGSAAGLLDERTQKEVADWKAEQSLPAKTEKIETVAELLQYPPLLSKIREESGLNAFFDPPWPQTIHLARQQMLHQLVPAIHLQAQKLLLASLSTIGGTGALGAWLWVASGGVALYEGGAIAALGLVWALRTLQKKWSEERERFVETSREDARRVLRDVEGRLGALVREGGRVGVKGEDEREWERAREALDDAKRLLGELRDEGKG